MFNPIKSIEEKNTATYDQFFIGAAAVFIIAFVLCASILVFFWHKLPPVIPLFYSLTWGEEQLTTPLVLLGVISGGLILSLFNLLLGWRLYSFSTLTSRMLFLGTSIVSIILTITIIRIIVLIT